ncbi:hypothetical protein LRC484719_45080 [Mycobacterium riyadhense]
MADEQWKLLRPEVEAVMAELLAALDTHISAAEAELARLVPLSPFATLTSVPGWGVVRVSNCAAALGDPGRWPGPRQIYRASGPSPMQYESAGERRDGKISREGSVALRRALIDLGIGLWLSEPAAKAYAGELKARGKTRRDHRLRAGTPRHPYRLCAGPRSHRLRPIPLELTLVGLSSVPALGAGDAGAVHLQRPQRSEDERGRLRRAPAHS